MAEFSARRPRGFMQSWPARLFHASNLLALTLMITSGLQIYNANPVFGGREGVPVPLLLTLGGWLAGGRHWHFAAMWLFAINLLAYGIYVLISRRWQHRFVQASDLRVIAAGAQGQRRVFAWHRLIYTLMIPVLLLALLTGLGMWKPVQFQGIVQLFGNDWQLLRMAHFASVPSLVGLATLHVWLGRRFGGERLFASMFW